MITLFAAITLSFTLLVSGTIAWLGNEDERDNVTKIAGLEGSVTVDNGTKTAVVTNESNQPAVVRVMITPVVTKSGALLPGDVLEYTLKTGWTNGGDGWLYYTGGVLAANGETGDDTGLFAATGYPAVMASPAFIFSEADIKVNIKAEFVAATRWDGDDDGTVDAYAYRDAWFRGNAPSAGPLVGIDTALAGAVDGSY
jgi:hypothetical protein